MYFCVELVCGFFRIHLLKFVYHFTRKKGEAITITKERSVDKTKQTNEDHKHENFLVGSILVDCQIYYKINSILIPEGKGAAIVKAMNKFCSRVSGYNSKPQSLLFL